MSEKSIANLNKRLQELNRKINRHLDRVPSPKKNSSVWNWFMKKRQLFVTKHSTKPKKIESSKQIQVKKKVVTTKNHTLPILLSGSIAAVYSVLAFTNNLPYTSNLGNIAVWIWASVAMILIGASIVWTEQ